MFPALVKYFKKTVHFILSSQHSPPHHSDSWEYSYHHCPSQGVFPPPAIQTLVSVSRNNWSVGWSCYPSPMLPTGCPWFTKTGVFVGLWYRIITISSGLVISIVSYTKTFRAFGHHQVEIQDYVQQRLSQPNALNMAWYRKAVYNALWVQLALIVRYVPQITVRIVIYLSAKRFGVSC